MSSAVAQPDSYIRIALRMKGMSRLLTTKPAPGVGREDRVRALDDRVELPEEVDLRGLVLDDRLDDHLAVREGLHVLHDADPVEHLVGVVELAAVLGSAQRLLQAPPAVLGPLRVRLDHDDIAAGPRTPPRYLHP